MSILNENWHTWYLGGADSESGLRSLKFRAQNPFLDKFGPKKSVVCFAWKLAHMVSQECWFFILTLVFWISKPKSIFGLKKSKLSILAENWHTWYLEDADSYSNTRPVKSPAFGVGHPHLTLISSTLTRIDISSCIPMILPHWSRLVCFFR